MDMTTQDFLKKALLDTQERVRDFMQYADQIEDKKLKTYFKEYAETEGRQARQLRSFVEDMCD